MRGVFELAPPEAYFIGLGSVTGIYAHHGFLIHGEWHLYGPDLAIWHVVPLALLFTARAYYGGSDASWILYCLALASYSYFISLATSIVLYRAFFHPLTRERFPGPWYARVTKLWHCWAVRHSKNFLVLHEMHAKYGDFVRTGPSEITVFRPEVFMAIDGPRSKCVKADWYDLLHPDQALVTARNKAKWKYNARVSRNVDQLDKCIESDAESDAPTSVRDLAYFFCFDTMGDISFSKSFQMMQNQGWHLTIARLQRALSLLGPTSPAPWLFHIGFRIAPRVGVLRDWFEALAWCAEQMRDRLENKHSEQPAGDLTHYLMEKGGQVGNDDAEHWLTGDSLFSIVAGSAPASATLVCILFMLAKHPHHAETIYSELNIADITDPNALSQLVHLNAVINETMRLYPAALSSGARKTTECGVTIGKTFIPPETTILCPRYTISRSENIFKSLFIYFSSSLFDPRWLGMKFIPERWSTRLEMLRNSAAFTPFGTGHQSCLGRTVAIDMMRLAVAKLVKKYQFSLVPGNRVEEDMVDEFLMKPGNLSLKFNFRR
ncbi:Uu.00g124150.m01.CDS01 [Anthostomella pinea]|uniref:Uu.00g124150.m01.CDS01 n=1 Tax=Anthostomella pinea TaxID=933095 RepID=A0AAI8VI75_9PEZI|nr:Uu.00g124150.m01.CDS01 [Anthostomella pinea]